MPRRTTKTLAALGAAATFLTAAVATAACSAPPAPGGPTSRPSASATTGTSSPSASPAPTVTAAAAASPTSSPTWPPQVAVPTPPPEMSREDETGAVAAARYFLDLYAYTQSTQDTGPWQAMSHPDCIFCQSVIDDIADRRAAGQIVHPAEPTVHSAEPSTLNPLMYAVALNLTTGPDRVLRTDGTVVSPGKRERGLMTAVMTRRGSQWTVREVSLEPDQ